MMPITGPKRACDQCHTVKEKCRRTDQSETCERCSRLGQNCQTTRCPAKTGRKPKVSRKVPYTVPISAKISTVAQPSPEECAPTPQNLSYNGRLTSNTALFSDLDKWERHFLNLMKDIMAPSPMDKFLVGPTFHEFHHSSFVQQLLQPTPVLRDAAVACAAVLYGDQLPGYASPSVEVGHKRAALVVSALRSFRISSEQDLVSALVLGVSMITFAMYVADGKPYLISHYILSLVKAQNADLSALDSTTMDLLMCLISTETFECLLRSHTPTIRIDLRGKERRVDRYLGLSAPIFAHFYDICEISSSIRHSQVASLEMLRSLETVHAAVDQWQPSTPDDFLERFTHVEVVGMLAQAKILRFAALLIIHRLYHPYGERDKEGYMLSTVIIGEFDMVLQLSRRSIPCTSLAYLVACFEIHRVDDRSAAIERSENVVTFSTQAQLRFKNIVNLVWNARDRGCQFSWFQLSDYVYSPGAQ